MFTLNQIGEFDAQTKITKILHIELSIMSASSSAAVPRNVLYVGGINSTVTKQLLHAAFIPFGDIVDIAVPLDEKGELRGYAFVEFEQNEDAAAALENMNLAELNGCILAVNLSKHVHTGTLEKLQRKDLIAEAKQQMIVRNNSSLYERHVDTAAPGDNAANDGGAVATTADKEPEKKKQKV